MLHNRITSFLCKDLIMQDVEHFQQELRMLINSLDPGKHSYIKGKKEKEFASTFASRSITIAFSFVAWFLVKLCSDYSILVPALNIELNCSKWNTWLLNLEKKEIRVILAEPVLQQWDTMLSFWKFSLEEKLWFLPGSQPTETECI